MGASSILLNRFLFVLFLLGFVSATMGHEKGEMRRPGFIYTRVRGRCTPQFWSSRREAWPRMVPQTSSVSKVFGSRAFERYKMDLTLLEATERNDDSNNAFSSLLKQSSAALLNSYARKDFPYSAWEVKTLLIEALVSEEAAASQATRFSLANEAIRCKWVSISMICLKLVSVAPAAFACSSFSLSLFTRTEELGEGLCAAQLPSLPAIVSWHENVYNQANRKSQLLRNHGFNVELHCTSSIWQKFEVELMFSKDPCYISFSL